MNENILTEREQIYLGKMANYMLDNIKRCGTQLNDLYGQNGVNPFIFNNGLTESIIRYWTLKWFFYTTENENLNDDKGRYKFSGNTIDQNIVRDLILFFEFPEIEGKLEWINEVSTFCKFYIK